jgi:protein-S-isoprenylcysteine O-methyltransferase Ste14
MGHRELLRWIGSVGIFYVLVPAWVILSDPLLARLSPWLDALQIPVWLRIVGSVAGLCGAGLAFATIRKQVTVGAGHPFDLTGKERLSRPTRHLLTRGPYFWSRNPMGLGDTLLYAGLAASFGAAHSLLVNVPVFAALVWWNHRVNERPSLLERFGADFLDYERTTSCLLPGPRTFRKLRRRSVEIQDSHRTPF